jgi:4-hydroxythreonine-4-phosphate dehydrogenase
MSKKIKLGITIGDFNGIGPEIIIKALSNQQLLEYITPVIYGSSKVMAYHKNIVKNNNFSFVSVNDIKNIAYNRINVYNVTDQQYNIELGKASAESGQLAMKAMEQAVIDARNGDIDAIVTAPINKSAMQMADFAHIGHTEFLTEKFGASETTMTLVSDNIRIALASNHVAVENIVQSLSKEKLIKKMKVLNKSMKQDFGIEKPVIAVLGLNPHAGDDGVIGQQEQEFIKPAIKEAKNNGVLVSGPFPADGFFGSGDFRKFDAVLAMFHDQGLVPFKLLSFGKGVNFTAGLPIIRTSPDHGTAYPIAGKNEASPSSMLKAIYLAKDLYLNRKEYLEATKDPVKKTPKRQEEIQDS